MLSSTDFLIRCTCIWFWPNAMMTSRVTQHYSVTALSPSNFHWFLKTLSSFWAKQTSIKTANRKIGNRKTENSKQIILWDAQLSFCCVLAQPPTSRPFRGQQGSSGLSVTWEDNGHHSESPPTPPSFPQLFLLGMTLHGGEHPFGQSGAAVLAVSPHHLLCIPSLLTGGAVRSGRGLGSV